MDKLAIANERLQTAHDNQERAYVAEVNKLGSKQKDLQERLNELNRKKIEVATANGRADAADDDVVEINAGGRIVSCKRSTLTQLTGTRLEALFSGRWENKMQRDRHGRIMLDVNPVAFQAIVHYLHELAISAEGSPPLLPSLEDEHKHILENQLELFGLWKAPAVVVPDSNIVKDETHVVQLHSWLKEAGLDGELRLLYRGSRDGLSNSLFHSNCDNSGSTLTVVWTTGGFVVGGFSDIPWTKPIDYEYYYSSKAFLFGISGGSISSPFKMKMKNPNDADAVCHCANSGPTFGSGYDLLVKGSTLSSYPDNTYELHSSWPLQCGKEYIIKEMEVFQVIPRKSTDMNKKPAPSIESSQVDQLDNFSKEVNAAINGKWTLLKEAEQELKSLEDSFKDEEMFVSFFACGRPQDVVTLNACGTIMTTRRQTLQLCKGSALASMFSEEVQEEKTAGSKSIKEWNCEDVVAWLNQLEAIPESVVSEFEDNQVTGRELLMLGAEGLKDFGVTGKGTMYLLLGEIKKLDEAGSDQTILVEHSPYCFEKILDHLRIESSFLKGFVTSKPGPPVIRGGEKERYEKVLNHLFPGASSSMFHDNTEDSKMALFEEEHCDY